MNDENMTDEDKLKVFASSFSKLGDAEVVTPAAVADLMCSKLSDDLMYGVIGSGSRIIDFSSETGEFSLSLLRRFEELGVFASEARNSICSIPASMLAYECLRKAYALLGLDADNIYPFTSYDLLKAIESDNGGIDESAVARISDILKQAKKPCDISLDDVVEEGTDKVEIAAIVGNPPYQINVADDSGREQLFPVYHIFIDCAARLSDYSILITPARFLSNAGKTPRDWNVARLLLGILKTTQHNPAATWRFVPLQDFTASSDIDWSKPVSDIDSQLYSEYGLSDEEIEFIESHIKPMD